MSYTIYNSQSASSLLAQSGKTVSCFPSGLIRVEQSFLTQSDALFTSRLLVAVGNDAPGGDSSPSIDGLKIFPESQERHREDGFTEYLVTSYGRVNSEGSSVLGVQLVTLSASYTHTYTPTATEETPNPTPANFAWTIKETWLADTYTVTRTMLASEPNSVISITPPTLGKVLKKREISGNRPGTSIPGYITVPGYSSIGADWESQLSSIDRRNFGNFDEVIITYVMSGTVSATAPV
jgi:hypothetical protein